MARRCPEGGIAYASVAAVVAAQAWRRRGHGVADVRALANPAATAAVFTAARGYSLIEVLGAATLLIVGLAGLTSGLSTLREADARADRLAASAAIAATWIDRTQRA
jgi:hypothetical protein